MPEASAEVPLVSNPVEEQLEDELAVCLSGGGYRAMLFHLGTLWYLNDAGLLAKTSRISSVSGGSITSGMLALRWKQLEAKAFASDAFRQLVADPILKIAGQTIDVKSVLTGLFWLGSVSDKIVARYREILYGDSKLSDLPDEPRFVINATNVQTGSLFRFSKAYIADWRVGIYRNPDLLLARAVAASSAFPPVLSPVRIDFPPNSFTDGSAECGQPPYNTRAILTDGGVYDNMGIETAWKRCRRILVSDAGARLQADPDPRADWAFHSLRINSLIDNQVRSLRKRQLVAAFKSGMRLGTYWGMWTDPAEYPAASTLSLPEDRARKLAQTPTRLAELSPEVQKRLVNFGYGMAERAVRSYYDTNAKAANKFPFDGGI